MVRTDPPPDEDAYGRFTNPERFRAVVDAASAPVSELVDSFDVEVLAGSSAVDFPGWSDGSAETIRLVPAVGAPLAILITDFPVCSSDSARGEARHSRGVVAMHATSSHKRRSSGCTNSSRPPLRAGTSRH